MQLTYSKDHSEAYVGGRASSAPMKAGAGRNNSGAEIPFGRFVAYDSTGAADLGPNDYLPAKLPSVAGDKLLGVAIHDHAHNPANTNGILDDDMFSIGYEGDFYVVTEQAVTPADPVFVRHTANGVGTAPGQVRKDIDTANAIALAGARFKGVAAAGEVVAIEIIRIQ